MPVKNPQEYKVRMAGNTYAFTDTPLNRGMLSVKDFLREEQKDLFPAIVTRIMSFGGVFSQIQSEPRFAPFFNGTDEEGAIMVSEALLDAFASTPFIPQTMDVDLDELHRGATAILAQDP